MVRCHLPRLGSLLACVAAAGCLPSAEFRDASDAFAKAAHGGAASFAGELQTAADVCRRCAELDFLQHRLEGSAAFAWGKSPTWNEWYAQQNPGGPPGDTWEKHCARLADADALQTRALAALSAYGDALQRLSGESDYSGSDMAGIVSSAGSIASQLTSNAAASSTIKSFASGAGDAVSQMGSLLFQAIVAGEMRGFIQRGDPIIEKLAAALTAYVAATDSEVRDLADRGQSALTTWELKLAPPHPAPPPDTAFLFYRFAAQEDAELRDLRASQATYKQLLSDLRESHRALAQSAASKSPAVEQLRRALGLAQSVLAAASTLRQKNN